MRSPQRLILNLLVIATIIGVMQWKRYEVRRRYAAEMAAETAAPYLNQPSSMSVPILRSQPETNSLPDGILAFNALSNETRVIEGEPRAQFTFDFTNVSPQPLTIIAVDTSCSCTTVDTPALPWIIAPHATGKIPVTMDVEHETGRDLETIALNTSRGTNELTVVAIILPASTNAAQTIPSQ